jgi:hypothetical protein
MQRRRTLYKQQSILPGQVPRVGRRNNQDTKQPSRKRFKTSKPQLHSLNSPCPLAMILSKRNAPFLYREKEKKKDTKKAPGSSNACAPFRPAVWTGPTPSSAPASFPSHLSDAQSQHHPASQEEDGVPKSLSVTGVACLGDSLEE